MTEIKRKLWSDMFGPIIGNQAIDAGLLTNLSYCNKSQSPRRLTLRPLP